MCVHVFAGALYCGGTSTSVRMLWEMTAEEVGLTLAFVCYILADFVVVGTEVPIMCLYEWVMRLCARCVRIACYACVAVCGLIRALTCCRSGRWRNGAI